MLLVAIQFMDKKQAMIRSKKFAMFMIIAAVLLGGVIIQFGNPAYALGVSDLSLIKSAPVTINAGGTLTYTITVSNAGPDSPTDVVVSDTVPSNLNSPSFSPSQGTCTSFPCALGTIAAGASARITVTATVDPSTPIGTIISNTASVTSSATDSTPADDSSTATTEVVTLVPETLVAGVLDANTGSVALAANQPTGYELPNNALPTADLDGIEFAPAAGGAETLDVTLSNQVVGVDPPANVNVDLSFDIVASGGLDLSQSTSFSGPNGLPKITFQVDKINGACPAAILLFFDVSLNQWVQLSTPTLVYQTSQSCIYDGQLPHFSKYAVGVTPAGTPAPRGSDVCTNLVYVNSETVKHAPSNIDYTRCAIIDDVPPKIEKAYMTPNDMLCLQVFDNVGVKEVTYGDGNEIPKWVGSTDQFCTDKQLPPVIDVTAKDLANNTSKMVVVNTNALKVTHKTQEFNAVVSKALNPHKDIEGMVISSTTPIDQIRITGSPEFASEHLLQLSDDAIQHFSGKEQTIVVKYQGHDSKHREMSGQLYIFAVNKGLLATYDVKVTSDDFRLSIYSEKLHAPYDLKLKEVMSLTNMHLNTMQQVEFQTAVDNPDQLSITQKNVLSMILFHLSK